MNNISAYGTNGCGYMDGEYVPLSEMRLPVTDLGFQLSDMCYDALHVYNGRYFRMDDHLDRFERSIKARRYETLETDRDGFAEILHKCASLPKKKRQMRKKIT